MSEDRDRLIPLVLRTGGGGITAASTLFFSFNPVREGVRGALSSCSCAKFFPID
jgi:hypothetical protein